MTWEEIARSHLAAAKLLVAGHPRSAVSRAYYAMHVALTASLLAEGYVPPNNRETQPHEAQARLVGLHLGRLGNGKLRDVRRLMRRSYKRRLDADYRRSVVVSLGDAREAARDGSALFVILGIRE